MVGIAQSPHLSQTFAPSLEKFEQTAKLAGDSGRMVVSKSASGTLELSTAKYTLKERALSFLSNLPFSNTFAAIRDHVSSLSSERATVIDLFVNALSKHYDEGAIDLLTNQNKHLAFAKVDLSQETFDKCMKLAQPFLKAVAVRPELPTAGKTALDNNTPSQAPIPHLKMPDTASVPIDGAIALSDRPSAQQTDLEPMFAPRENSTIGLGKQADFSSFSDIVRDNSFAPSDSRETTVAKTINLANALKDINQLEPQHRLSDTVIGVARRLNTAKQEHFMRNTVDFTIGRNAPDPSKGPEENSKRRENLENTVSEFQKLSDEFRHSETGNTIIQKLGMALRRHQDVSQAV